MVSLSLQMLGMGVLGGVAQMFPDPYNVFTGKVWTIRPIDNHYQGYDTYQQFDGLTLEQCIAKGESSKVEEVAWNGTNGSERPFPNTTATCRVAGGDGKGCMRGCADETFFVYQHTMCCGLHCCGAYGYPASTIDPTCCNADGLPYDSHSAYPTRIVSGTCYTQAKCKALCTDLDGQWAVTSSTSSSANDVCKIGESVQCPDTTVFCSGNQCCPDGSLCPSAEESFGSCPKQKAWDCLKPTPAPTPVVTLKHGWYGCTGSGRLDNGNSFMYSVNATNVIVTSGHGRMWTGVTGKIDLKNKTILWSNGDVYTFDGFNSLV